MILEELWKIKDEQSAKKCKMTYEELKVYYAKSTEMFKERLGKDRFIPTDKPNVWRHVGKKTAAV